MIHERTVQLQYLREGAYAPLYATAGAAAADLRCAADAPLLLRAGERLAVPTGIAISIPADTVALICARSGLATKHGITLANGVGVIDSDYRGELLVALSNQSAADFVIHPGDRIAQLMLVPVCRAVFAVASALDETDRGAGGFGSTGTH